MHFLLVHGAFQKADVWSQVIGLLEGNGHYAEAISLPGRGDPSGVVVYLQDYVEVIRKTLQSSNRKWRLVCHSFAGIHGAIAVSESVEKIERLIFLAANVAKEGETTYSLLDESFQAQLRQAVQSATGLLEFPGKPTNHLFNCSQYDQLSEEAMKDEDERIKKEVLCSEPALPYYGVVRYKTDLWSCLEGRVKYYCGTEDRAINECQAARYAERAGVSPTWIEGNHQLMHSNPFGLVTALTS